MAQKVESYPLKMSMSHKDELSLYFSFLKMRKHKSIVPSIFLLSLRALNNVETSLGESHHSLHISISISADKIQMLFRT